MSQEPTDITRTGEGSEDTVTSGASPLMEGPTRVVRPPSGEPFGRYLLIEELGRGGMGIVWKAWDTELSRIVALKQILLEALFGEAALERFLREARLAAKLRHPNIVSVHDVGVIECQHYFTADYIQGRTLARALADGPVPIRQGVAWIHAVADALAYAHEHGVLHRDVKPENILIDTAGHPHIMDFGLAREMEAGKGMTATGDVMGTPAYMSPEQAMGEAHRVGPASDQFSLGATLYEVLTGKRPFDGNTVPSILIAVMKADPQPPRRVNARVHRDLETICLKAMEKNPRKRYVSMGAMADDLGGWLEGEPITARAVSGVERVWRKAVKHRALVAPSVVAVLLAVGFGAYAFTTRLHRAEEQAQKRRELDAAEVLRQRSVNVAYEKEYRVSEVLRRFRALSPVLQELDAIRYGGELDGGERADGPSRAEATFPPDSIERRKAELWAHVQAFMDGTPGDTASQATMWPFAGWAKLLCRDWDTGKAWMRKGAETDPDVPYGKLVGAMDLFMHYVERMTVPPLVPGGPAGITFAGKPSETDEMRGIREEFRQLLQEAGEARVWGREGAEEYREAFQAMSATMEGDYEAAESGLAKAIEGTELAPMRVWLLQARCKVRYLRMEIDGAYEDLKEVLTVHSGDATGWNFLGLIACGAAGVAESRGLDQRAGLERAVADFSEAIRRKPGFGAWYANRGNATATLGKAEEARGIDPRKRYEMAIADDYRAACLFARASEGREGNGARKEPLPVDAAARLRGQAFDVLRQAVDLGYADVQRLAGEPDLASLREDDRWKRLLEGMARK